MQTVKSLGIKLFCTTVNIGLSGQLFYLSLVSFCDGKLCDGFVSLIAYFTITFLATMMMKNILEDIYFLKIGESKK